MTHPDAGMSHDVLVEGLLGDRPQGEARLQPCSHPNVEVDLGSAGSV